MYPLHIHHCLFKLLSCGSSAIGYALINLQILFMIRAPQATFQRLVITLIGIVARYRDALRCFLGVASLLFFSLDTSFVDLLSALLYVTASVLLSIDYCNKRCASCLVSPCNVTKNLSTVIKWSVWQQS